ncbi:MAG: Hsp33 family molecular chaperone HslO [Clostridia bacterium]|nr:Hsp33 family molecular chaperone HslO [Clostridia bacterium]
MSIIKRAIDSEGLVRVSFIDSRDIVETAQNIHKTSPVATAALGRSLTMTALIGSGMKSPHDTISAIIKGDGPLGSIVCTADGNGAVKGCVQNPFVEIPLKKNGKLDVGGAVGAGSLSVTMDLGLKKPYVGQIPLVSGEIAEDFTYYFAKSQQIPTAVSLGVLVDRDYSVKQAGGLFVQLMPGCDDETAALIEKNVNELPPVTDMLEKGYSADLIITSVLAGLFFKYLDDAEYEYRCDCNRAKIEKALISLGETELLDMIQKDHGAEVTCRFCPEVYNFTESDLADLIKRAK